ncbi:uncharacterized protein LOC123887338 isoform X1 [Trifolium pratense]|uniref:uncharacterized protein LOC123887338 isoform X1 n=1 Tax=Trifolium pratense TaxID=57577 RepID=UPI001E694A3A|nr:uncharacterized protein LOC123887338 isoform X1 [Trifolium pratense]
MAELSRENPIAKPSTPYLDSLVANFPIIAADIDKSSTANAQRNKEIPRADEFMVQSEPKSMVNTIGDCIGKIVESPLNKALPVTTIFSSSQDLISTHFFPNEDSAISDSEHADAINKDVVRNQGLSLHCEIPPALHFMTIGNKQASCLGPKFQLHCDKILEENTLVSLTASIKTCLSYVRQNVPTHSPPPKPPDCALLNPLLSLEPPNSVAVENRLMFPPPPKPPGHGFQLTQGELQVTRATAVLPPPPEPPDVEHIVVVLQGFATLIFPCLTGLRSLCRNGYRVTDSILESLSNLSQLVILHKFDNKFYTIVSILIMKLVHARTQWNFLKVSNQYSGKGNVNLDEMYVSYGNRGPPAVVNYTLHDLLSFHAYGANINQNKEMCVEALQHLKSFCPFVDNLKLDITCINAITSCFSRFEYSNSESWHLGREAKVDVGWWIKYLSVLRIDNFQIVITIGNSTFFVFYLSDIHFSNYHVCHDVELVSTVAFSHAKGSLQIPNESLDTKMRHQATQLCGNTIQLIEKLHATLNTAVLLHNCGVCDMSKMILDCSNFLIVGYIKTGVLERKVLLSFELVPKCWMVVMIQVDYGDFDFMRLNGGCAAYCVLKLKKRDITSYSSSAVLSQFNLIHYYLWTTHLSIWLSKFNIQGNIGDSYGLCVLVEHVLFYHLCANFEGLNGENKCENEGCILDIVATHVEYFFMSHKKFHKLFGFWLWLLGDNLIFLTTQSKKWEPGGDGYYFHAEDSLQFKQWDPGKICVVINFFNLEDKVGFKGEGIVMNPPNWIGPNKS